MPDISQKVTFQVSPTDKTCFANPHDMFQWFLTKLVSAHIELTYPLDATGATPPAAGDRTANGTWRRTVNGVVVGEYTWDGTLKYWVARYDDRLIAYDATGNPTPKERRWTIATPAEIKMLDRDPSAAVGEKSDETVSDVTGPFWEIDPDFVGRVPISPGDVPSPAFPSSTLHVDVNQDSGAGEVELAMDQLPVHGHTTRVYDDGSSGNPPAFADFYGSAEPSLGEAYAGVAIAVHGGKYADTGNLVPADIDDWGHSMDVIKLQYGDATNKKRTVTPVTMLPAVRGLYAIRRTDRKYLRFPG